MAYLPFTDAALATQNITAQDVASSTATGANNQPITTGTPTANSAATFTLDSRETVLVMISGTWTGTLMSEGSFDGGTTWVSKAVKQIGTGYTANSLTANFAGAINVAGLTNYRIRSTATWAGTATVLVELSNNPHSFYIANNLAIRDPTNQSTVANVIANDTGYNGMGANNVQKVLSFTTSTPGGQILVAATDVRGYAKITVVLTTAGTGLVWKGQWSPASGGTYTNIDVWQNPGATTAAATTLGNTANLYYETTNHGPFFQLAISALTSGTVSGFVILSTTSVAWQNGQGSNIGTYASDSTSVNLGSQYTVSYMLAYSGVTFAERVRTANGANTTTGTGLIGVGNLAYNNTTWDSLRGNTSAALIAAGTTTTQTGISLTTYNANSLLLLVNITAITGTLTVAINGVTASTYSTNLLTSTALAVTGVTALRVFPGATPTANLVANDRIPRALSITATVTGTCTYGVDYALGAA